MSTRYTIPSNNLDTNNPNTLLSYLGFTSDHAINEAILDKLFLHEKQASHYAHEKFRPSCPRNLFASRDQY